MDDGMDRWIERVQAGDKEAFSPIVRTMQARIVQYCYPMLGNRHDAEDAAQETFVRAYERIGLYRPGGSFQGWLLTIAHRVCLNKLKKRKSLLALVRRTMLMSAGDDAASGGVRDESADDALGWLDRLQPATRGLVVLRAIHGRSYEDIAAIVGGSPQALRKRYERARERLREEIGKQWSDRYGEETRTNGRLARGTNEAAEHAGY